MFLPLFYLASLLGTFPVIVLVVYGKKAFDTESSFVLPFLYLTLFATLYELIASWLFAVNSSVWFAVYLVLEFIALAAFYFRICGRRYRKAFIAVSALFTVTFCLRFVSYGGSEIDFDAVLSVIETVFVYIASICWFKQIFENLPEKSLFNTSGFYYISAFLLYFSGTMFLFLFSSLFTAATQREYWCLNILFTIVLRSLIIIGVWKGRLRLISYSGSEPLL